MCVDQLPRWSYGLALNGYTARKSFSMCSLVGRRAVFVVSGAHWIYIAAFACAITVFASSLVDSAVALLRCDVGAAVSHEFVSLWSAA